MSIGDKLGEALGNAVKDYVDASQKTSNMSDDKLVEKFKNDGNWSHKLAYLNEASKRGNERRKEREE